MSHAMLADLTIRARSKNTYNGMSGRDRGSTFRLEVVPVVVPWIDDVAEPCDPS